MRGLEAGELRIAAFTTAAAGLLPDPIKRFRVEHPHVRVTLHESEPPEALDQLAEGEVDVAVVFTYGGVPEAWAAAALTPIVDEPLYVVMPVDHRLADEPVASIACLDDEDWLKGPHQAAEIVAGDADAIPAGDFVYRGQDFVTVQRLVAAGAGVAVVPRLALNELATDVVARPLGGDPSSRRVFAATQRSLAPRAGAQRFVELLADGAQTLAQAWRDDRALVEA
jgi:DNA-binding transcriptional LysR family regulator